MLCFNIETAVADVFKFRYGRHHRDLEVRSIFI